MDDLTRYRLQRRLLVRNMLLARKAVGRAAEAEKPAYRLHLKKEQAGARDIRMDLT